jgi:hypothetical protein
MQSVATCMCTCVEIGKESGIKERFEIEGRRETGAIHPVPSTKRSELDGNTTASIYCRATHREGPTIFLCTIDISWSNGRRMIDLATLFSTYSWLGRGEVMER